MAIDFGKLGDKIANEIIDKLQAGEQPAKKAGDQVVEAFGKGIESGMDDVVDKIAASSVKINQAFKQLATRIKTQKENLVASIGKEAIVIDVDFSKIDLDAKDFKNKVDNAFKNFKVDNPIEFDTKASETQFKNILKLYMKYGEKLNQLQTSAPKLTDKGSKIANAQEQLVLIDALKEIQTLINGISGMSIKMPRIFTGDVKEIRTRIDAWKELSQAEIKGEEAVAKRRKTHDTKLQQKLKEVEAENKELAERNKILEEKTALTNVEPAKPAKKTRGRKSKEAAVIPNPDNATKRANVGKEMQSFALELENIQKEFGDTNKWLNQFNILMGQIQQGTLTASEAVTKLREEISKQPAGIGQPIVSKPEIVNQTNEQVEANKKLESSYKGLAEAVEEFVRIRNEKRKHKGDDKFWELDSKETELRQKLVGYIPEGTTAHSETYQKLEYKLNRKENRTGEITSAEDILKIVESGISKAKAEQNKLAKETADIEIKSSEQSVSHEQTQLDLAKEQLEVEKQITAEKEKQYGYHAGKFRDDGFKAENLFQSTPGRSTGFYGTGTYMTDKAHLGEITTGSYGQRPLSVIDPDMYNLFDATNDKTAGQLHQFLKSVTNKSFGGKGENIKSLYAQFKELFPKEKIITYEEFKVLINELQQYVKTNRDKYPANKFMDSVSTKFMKNFGYEGVDTRGTKHADTTYGTIVYDLKEESIILKEVTDEMQKQEIIAGNIASVIKRQNSAPQIHETESGQMSMLPDVEKEVDAKNKLADANEKVAQSKKKVTEATHGEQLSFDDIVSEVAEETNAIEQSGKVAEKAAESKNKLADANKKAAAKGSATFDEDGEGGKNIWTTSRSGESLDTLNLPVRYVGENGQDAVQMFAGLKSQIEEMTGKPVTIDFSSNVNEDGQLEAIGATLKYVNEEAGVTVKQFYDIERGEGDMLVATQSYEKATLSATKAAKNFNAEMQRKVAEAQIKTLETQMGELKLDLTDVKKAAADINDQASLDKFNLELKAAKEEAKQLKAELKGQNALDTIASMERSALALPSELERIKRKLEELGNVDGVESISDALKSVEEEYQKFLTTDKSEEKTKAFRSLSTSMTWIKAEMKNLADLNSKQKKQETKIEKEELAKQKAAREAYLDWWKATLNTQDEQAKADKPYLNYGKTTANAAERKRDQLIGQYDTFDVVTPEFETQMDTYKQKVQEVINLRNQFANDPNAAKDPELVKQFQKVSYEAEQARKGIKAILDEETRMAQMSEEQGFKTVSLLPEDMADVEGRMMAMAKEYADGRVEIKGWNADHTKLNYTITNAKGTVQEMTIALGQGTNTMYQYRTATKETGTAFDRFMKGIRTKAKEISTFILGGGSIYKLISIGREGIRVVRDIDIALTELKKVTDETEETYDKFLDTASKTAAKVGSTIKDVISSTADWARLGYSMEQAAKFAESTQILMNVSEFTDVSRATDTLISSVQAFGYTAETSMEVVDLLNTIGNNYAISTADLASSLTKSSASLVAAGGDLAEAAALTATANAIRVLWLCIAIYI